MKNGETPVSGPMQQEDEETTSDPGQGGGGGIGKFFNHFWMKKIDKIL